MVKASPPQGQAILEVKRFPDGRQEEYLCQALLVTPWRAVVRFVSQEPRPWRGRLIPPGAVTYGFFWRRRPYNLYRMADPEGRLIAHRFDVISDVLIQRGRISYLDLALDLLSLPDGRILVEDEEEVAAYAARGLLSGEQLALIDRARQLLLARHRAIIAAAEACLGRLISFSPP